MKIKNEFLKEHRDEYSRLYDKTVDITTDLRDYRCVCIARETERAITIISENGKYVVIRKDRIVSIEEV